MKPRIYIKECEEIPRNARIGLIAAGARTLEEILRFSERDIVDMPGCGGFAVRKITVLMARHGYQWPMREKRD